MENKMKKIKDIIVFILLMIWILIPILKELCIVRNEIAYVYIIGLIGMYLFIFKLYKDFMSKHSKKEFLKDNLPIFIFCIFMLWTLISSIFASDRNSAFNGDGYRQEGYLTYLAYAGFFGLAYFLESKKLKNILLNMFVIVAILNIIFMLLGSKVYIEGNLLTRDVRKGVFDNINHYGYYLLLVTIITGILFIYQKNKYFKVFYLCAYTFLIYFLILNNTFGVYLALCCALVLFLIYCIYKKQRVFLSAVPIIILIIMSLVTKDGQEIIALNNIKGFKGDVQKITQVFFYNGNNKNSKNNEKTDGHITKEEVESTGSGRIRIWKYGIKFALEKPIFVYGPDNLERKYLEKNIVQDRPHNLLIQLANTSGIPGLILYVTAVGIILIRAIKTMNENNSLNIVLLFALVAYLISAMFGNSMYYRSPYFFILLGFLMMGNVKEVYKKIDEGKESLP